MTFKGLKKLIKLNPGLTVADIAGKAKRIGRITKFDKGRVHISWLEDESHSKYTRNFEPYETDHSVSELVRAKVHVVVIPKPKIKTKN